MLDAADFVTEYKHDLLGRKVEEKRANRVTHYGYDPLGFLAWEERGQRRIEYTNDALGQMRKKSIDRVLDTLWTYDAGGNVASMEHGGITTFDYDSHNRLIEKVDPEGHRTSVLYEKGPQVLLKKTTDPMGIETIETYNPHGQLLKREVEGQVVEEFEYDKLFRLKKQDHLTFGYTFNGNRAWITEANTRTTQWTHTPGDRILTKHKPNGTVLLHEYDAQWRLKNIGTREFRYDSLDRIIGGTGFARTLDPFGNINREEWSNGLWIESDYDDWDRPIERRLPDHSRIRYNYEGPFLKEVARVSKDGTEVYSHVYDNHDARGNPQLETGLFGTMYEYDQSGRRIRQQNPYFQETVDYDPSGNLVRKGNTTYTYDAQSQMTSESDRFTAKYDAHYNLKELNGAPPEIEHDLNGNLLRPGFVYNDFDQLVEASGERYVYDSLGRRLQRGTTSFLYIGDEEIGAFEGGKPKELKILGFAAPIAIEIGGKPYFPVTDVQGTIRLLIDGTQIGKRNDCDSFGAGLSETIPYAYAGKRYDPKTGLLYFGKRYYDPSLHRWLTPDPLGPMDHSNMYQYVFNNPFVYRDPTGENVFGFLCGIGQIILGGTLLVTGTAIEIATCGAYTIAFTFQAQAGLALMASGCTQAMLNARDISFDGYPTSTWKNTEVYAPDRPLPLTDDGVPIPATDAPHTELGTRDGRKGKYPQAREFDKNGKPVRDIDFTDHGKPQQHTNPHQHRPKSNPTGGTPERGKPEPVPEWSN
jgi:RHS repeat-associated protein